MQKYILTIAAFLLAWSAFAQSVTVTGKVTDENDEPLPSAVLLAGGDPEIYECAWETITPAK